jgi:hypothetical protein
MFTNAFPSGRFDRAPNAYAFGFGFNPCIAQNFDPVSAS